ncbi:MAG TPA: family 10 glycosylhydrolase, partial [Vicinamibacterales bacterium]|nr:family 10 glycosylhydrolase [Vicinamibacterales bacterium]
MLTAPCSDGGIAAAAAPFGGEPRAEGRAIWVNRFEYSSAADIERIIAQAASANFNVVYFQVRGQGDAYYRSNLEPCAIRLCGTLGNGTPPFDPLEIAIREAHARGIQLHAWLNALTGWASPRANNTAYCALLVESRPGSPRHMLLAHPEWVMTARDGTPMDCYTSQEPEYAYVSPGIAAVRSHLARVAADVVRRYPVDGVHLDRIRYPGPAWSYDEPSLAAFRARYGRTPSGGADPDWNRFRKEQIDATVRAVFDSVTAVRPAVSLSAAVWPIHDRATFGWPSS